MAAAHKAAAWVAAHAAGLPRTLQHLLRADHAARAPTDAALTPRGRIVLVEHGSFETDSVCFEAQQNLRQQFTRAGLLDPAQVTRFRVRVTATARTMRMLTSDQVALWRLTVIAAEKRRCEGLM
jgi:hypothetical protein